MSRRKGLKSTNYNPKQTIKIMLKSFEGNTHVSPLKHSYLLVQFLRCLKVESARKYGYRMLHLRRCRHLNLPLAGFAIGCHNIDFRLFYLCKKRRTDALRGFVVFFLESVCSGDAAALRRKNRQLHTRNLAEKVD